MCSVCLYVYVCVSASVSARARERERERERERGEGGREAQRVIEADRETATHERGVYVRMYV